MTTAWLLKFIKEKWFYLVLIVFAIVIPFFVPNRYFFQVIIMSCLLSIGIALAGEPKMILLDEPTGGLIQEDTNEIMHLIKKINKQGITICLIEHKMRMVMGLAERIVVLNYGSKIAEGTPKEIGRNQKVIEAYLGRKRNA